MANTKELRDISKELNSLQQKLDSTNQAIVGFQNNPTKIEIVHVAPDYFSAGVTLLATFLGAYFAYQINALGEKLKDRRARIDEVNYAINTLILNLNTLLNFKRQFLTKGDAVIAAMRSHASKYAQRPSEEILTEYRDTFRKQIDIIHEENLDEVFQKWDELEFPELFSQQGVLFLIEHRPDDLRIFDVVRDQIKTINRNIKVRNELWPRMVETAEAGFPPDIARMGILFEFLGLRNNIKEAANLSIAAIVESLERLKEYQDAKLASPKFLGIRLWGKFKTMRWSLPEEMTYLIPDKSQYSSVLRRPPANK